MQLTSKQLDELGEIAAMLRDQARMAILDAYTTDNSDVRAIHLAASDLYVARCNLIIDVAKSLGAKGMGLPWVRSGNKLEHVNDPAPVHESNLIEVGVHIGSKGCRERYVGKHIQCACPQPNCWVTYAKEAHAQGRPSIDYKTWLEQEKST